MWKRLAACAAVLSMAGCGGGGEESAGDGGADEDVAEADTTEAPASSPATTQAPTSDGAGATTTTAPAGGATARFEGSIGGVQVVADGSGQAACDDVGGTPVVVLHHVDWTGDGADALDDLGIAVAPNQVRLGVLEDAAYTDGADLDRPLLDHPSLLNYMGGEDPASLGLAVAADHRAVALDHVPIDDPGDPTSGGTISGTFGCSEASLAELPAPPSDQGERPAELDPAIDQDRDGIPDSEQ